METLKFDIFDATLYTNRALGSRNVTVVWKWKTPMGEVPAGFCQAGPEIHRLRDGESTVDMVRKSFYKVSQWGPVTGMPGKR